MAGEREIPAQLKTNKLRRSNLPVDEDITSMRNGRIYPSATVRQMHNKVFIGRVSDINHLVLELIRVRWLKTSHGLNDVGNAMGLEETQVCCTSEVREEEVGKNLEEGHNK